MVSKISYFIVFGALLFSSCNQPLNQAEYSIWLEDDENGLTRSVADSNSEFVATLIPNEYMNSLCSARVDSNLIFFNIKVNRKKDIDDKDGYKRYMSFYLSNDIRLISQADSIFPVYTHYEDFCGLKPYNTIHVAFHKSNIINPKDSQVYLIYTDKFNSNSVSRFSFDLERLYFIPELSSL